MDIIKVYCDGGSRGNPGPAASAFVVYINGKEVYSKSIYLGRKTNNFAEYKAVEMALNWLSQEVKEGSVQMVLDSLLVVKQLTGEYKVKSRNLIDLVSKIKRKEKSMVAKILYKWSSRENNRVSDRLVNEELDRHQ